MIGFRSVSWFALNPEGNLELARFCDRIASDSVEKIIDKRVAEGKLIRVDSLLHRQQRSLPSPEHAPGSTVIDLVATPIIEPKPLSEFAAYQRQWHSHGKGPLFARRRFPLAAARTQGRTVLVAFRRPAH